MLRRIVVNICRTRNTSGTSIASASTVASPVSTDMLSSKLKGNGLVASPFVDPITSEEYVDRRNRLVELIRMSSASKDFDEHLLVLPSAEQKYMAHHVPYPFRQDSNVRYLSGHLEPRAVFVVSVSSSPTGLARSGIFLHQRDAKDALWDGESVSPEVARAKCGADFAEPLSKFSNYFSSWLRSGGSRRSRRALWYALDPDAPLDLQLERDVLLPCLKKTPPAAVYKPELVLHRLRVVKSPQEAAAMRLAGRLGSRAMRDTMVYSRPDVNEAELWGRFEWSCRRGHGKIAYPPVVAGGIRANTIHYMRNDSNVLEGEMCLMDAGAECHGYVSDITRTWPVCGQFTDAQRVLYGIVHETLDDCVNAVNTAASSQSLDRLYNFMLTRLLHHAKTAGIFTATGITAADYHGFELARKLCPHHLSHWLGMDVHDCASVPRTAMLRPGMAFPLEPGLYCGAKELADKLRPEFYGLGIRLENDYLVDTNGTLELLNVDLPLDVKQVEQIVKS